MSDPLAQALIPTDTLDSLTVRVGTVTSTSPLEVTIAGGTGLSTARISSYSPTLNDVVLILQTKTDLIILGLIVSGG